MSKKLVYMTLDCETATLPFANEIAKGDGEKKKKIAISKALIYDIGWTLMYRDGTVFEKKQFLITETFSIPSVFNTAYYASKRPLYLAMLERGEIECLPWKLVAEQLVNDLNKSDFIGAFNSMFDFKKAIPFTELYIQKLYSPEYYAWEKMQYNLCEKIASESYKKPEEKEFDPNHFIFRGRTYNIFDVWGMACTRLINHSKYKNMCLDNVMLTNSGDYFKTSAESVFRYLREQYDFEEAHTALADAEIESFILAKILKKGKIDIGIEYFPFKTLGHPTDYIYNMRSREKRTRYAKVVYDKMANYCLEKDSISNYCAYILNKMEILESILNDENII